MLGNISKHDVRSPRHFRAICLLEERQKRAPDRPFTFGRGASFANRVAVWCRLR